MTIAHRTATTVANRAVREATTPRQGARRRRRCRRRLRNPVDGHHVTLALAAREADSGRRLVVLADERTNFIGRAQELAAA